MHFLPMHVCAYPRALLVDIEFLNGQNGADMVSKHFPARFRLHSVHLLQHSTARLHFILMAVLENP